VFTLVAVAWCWCNCDNIKGLDASTYCCNTWSGCMHAGEI